MRLIIWRGPERDGHYKNGDIVEVLDTGQDPGRGVTETNSHLFEIVDLPDDPRPRSVIRGIDYKTRGEVLPASMRKLGKTFRTNRRLLDRADDIKNKRRMYWDGNQIRSKQDAL